MKREFTARELAVLFGGELRAFSSGPTDGRVHAKGAKAQSPGRDGGSDVDLADIRVCGFVTDSREAAAGDLFIAIRGANVDGRDYLGSTAASLALVEPGHRLVDGVGGGSGGARSRGLIVVEDVVEALARFGRALRADFRGPVIGVTGSVGKSTVKELIAAALSPLGEVVKTEGNRNTEYTAPLMWASVSEATAAVVVEMGMRGRGQIAHLASIARPTIGVITNIGVTHLSELGSVENIALAKAELIEGLSAGATLDGEKVAIYPADDPWRSLLLETAGGAGAGGMTFGTSAHSDAQVLDYRAEDWSSSWMRIRVRGRDVEARLPVVGRHFALGAAAALLAAEATGVAVEDAARALSGVQLPPMRMAVRERDGITWVLDMYNAAPASTVAALETVAEVASGLRYAVVGEMRELGLATEAGHQEVGAALVRCGFAAAITLDAGAGGDGPTRWIIEAATDAGMPASNLVHAASFEEVREWLSNRTAGDTILVKGSRGVELEKVVPNAVTA